MRDKPISKEQIVVICLCLFLSPLLFYGYTADDRQHVLQHILLIERGLWSSIEIIYNDVSSMQRFFPLHIVLYSTLFKIFDYDSLLENLGKYSRSNIKYFNTNNIYKLFHILIEIHLSEDNLFYQAYL
jgi:hypothetical protein